MEPSWTVVIVAVSTISGILITLVPFFKMVGDWLSGLLKARRERKQTHESQTIEGRKLDGEERDKILTQWKEYAAELKHKVDELEVENDKLKKGDSLAQPTITKLYRAANRIGIEIDILETIFLKEFINCGDEKLHDALKKQVDVLKECHEKLMERLP